MDNKTHHYQIRCATSTGTVIYTGDHKGLSDALSACRAEVRHGHGRMFRVKAWTRRPLSETKARPNWPLIGVTHELGASHGK